MKRWWSPYTERICPGHESSITRLPSAAPSSRLPSASTSAGCTPGSGLLAEPGLRSVAPGIGVISMPPVSVCHQVSTTGQRESPMYSKYQRQASGLIGSPTLPSTRSDLREVFFTGSRPSRISARMAVGAV